MGKEYVRSVQVLPRAMVYVDGENLAIRGAAAFGASTSRSEMIYERDVYLWFKNLHPFDRDLEIVRTYYYTAIQGDTLGIENVVDELKGAGVQIPRVFKKMKGKGSKRVDVSLAVDMLTHASAGHYDTAVLVAGDEDYVPLVEAVQREGCRVSLWFIDNGLSPVLRRTADSYTDISELFVSGT